jgi:hypothetical protein
MSYNFKSIKKSLTAEHESFRIYQNLAQKLFQILPVICTVK